MSHTITPQIGAHHAPSMTPAVALSIAKGLGWACRRPVLRASWAGRPLASTKSLPSSRALGMMLSEWMARLDLDASAVQCWSSLQQNYGVNCCTIMSMMSETLMPSACEVDVAGTVAMYALQLASGVASALVDI